MGNELGNTWRCSGGKELILRKELSSHLSRFILLSGPAGAGNSRPFEMTDVHDKKTRSFTQLEIMCFCSEVGEDVFDESSNRV